MLKIKLISTLIKYKYSILIPVGFMEGHIVSLASGFLARLGYINPYLAGLCIAIGNLIGDILLYWLGYYKGENFIKKYSGILGLTPELVEKGKLLFHKHKVKVLMISKLTNGFGFAMAILFSAGAIKIPFRKYMFWNIIGEFIWTGLLITIGYFLGSAYDGFSSTLSKIFFILFSFVILVLIFFNLRKLIKRKVI